MDLREKIKWAAFNEITAEGDESWAIRSERIADAILAIPELDTTPTKMRILAALGGLRDSMTPEQVRTVQWFADQFPTIPNDTTL